MTSRRSVQCPYRRYPIPDPAGVPVRDNADTIPQWRAGKDFDGDSKCNSITKKTSTRRE